MTTLAVSAGAGPLTRRVSHGLWRAGQWRRSAGHRQPLSGVGIAVASLLVWIGLAWLGWALVLHGSETAVVDPATDAPGSTVQRLVAAGAMLSTAGSGPFEVGSDPWGLVTAAAGLHGLVTASLSITFFVTVVQAATDRRTLAVQIHGLGATPDQLADQLADADPWMVEQVVEMASDIRRLAERHLAFPILHYFHASEVRASAPHALAVAQVAVERAPRHGATVVLASALDRFWETVDIHATHHDSRSSGEIARRFAADDGHPAEQDG